MNQTTILKKAWNNVINYRALWIFGMILALVSTTAGSAWIWAPDDDDAYARKGITIQPLDGESFWDAAEREFTKEINKANRELDELFRELNINAKADVVAFFTTLLAISVGLYLIGLVARYVSRTALIRMVDRHQETGGKESVRQGFRLGWLASS